jgi:hypothetical protein
MTQTRTLHDGHLISGLIQETWAELLGLDAVGPEDDFFAIGGSSVLVAAAIARLQAKLGLDLPLLALFEAPTPAELAELIAELRGQPDRPAGGTTPFLPEWVVPLQRDGGERPVFVFPAGHSEVAALAKEAQIAVHVGRRHPFWGFRSEHPDLDAVRAEGVAALAAAYVKQIRAIQPHGPYLLSGNCAGGYLAWETAKHLVAAGEEIAGLLLYEVPLRADFAALLPGITPANISRPWRLSLHYRPLPLPVDVTVLMTEPWQARGWWQPWREVTGGAFATVVIPVAAVDGKSFQFLERREAIIARHVRDWIARAEARGRER